LYAVTQLKVLRDHSDSFKVRSDLTASVVAHSVLR